MQLNRFVFAGIAVLALGGTLVLINNGLAGDTGSVGKAVDKIAEAIGKGDTAGATKLAKKVAADEEELYVVMGLFKPRSRKGYGVGKNGDVIPDGIELKIRALARDLVSNAKLKKEGDALIEMAHRTAAITEVGRHLAPKKDKKDWEEFTKGSIEGSQELVKAIRAQSPAAVKAAAERLNASCNNCHSKFRDS